MPPSVFCILIWRLTVQILYPDGYMGCSLQEALHNEHLIWSKGDSMEVQVKMLMRDSFRTTLMLVILIEMMNTLDAFMNIPIPRVRVIRL
ncbi:uncharacterized protein [Drosophila takahashii]|uniref:uncharacterized protein n=1 Tax=Drosophila takahashii TaxID=29030 RepID=UPI0007E77137|nr:uncharacterized protein LOC108064570 [Drosophila takahashii]